ncbi:MAG: sec-independent translocase [Propionibacteriaceae bacterium]
MPNLNMSEIILLLVLAVIIFGPDRLPELARKAARLVKFLRGIANNAQDTVRRELGPEYADLQLSDLQPKNIVKKVLAEDYQDIETEITSLRTEVTEVSDSVVAVTAAVTSQESSEASDIAQRNAQTAMEKISPELASFDSDGT